MVGLAPLADGLYCEAKLRRSLRNIGAHSLEIEKMKPLAIVGLLLALAGGYILVRGLTYSSDKAVAQLGDFKASIKEERAVPTWVGGVAIVGGLILVAAGLRKKA